MKKYDAPCRGKNILPGVDNWPGDNYNIITDTIRFEWDENKNQINQRKHGISFEEAATVFYDEYAILFDDPDHSVDEDRFLIIGTTRRERICIVSHCYRGKEGAVRIISARKATRSEKRIYIED